MVMFDGLDNAKELSVLFGGVEIDYVHVLAIDGPGQGEAVRLQGIPSRYDYEVPGRAAYVHLQAARDRSEANRRDGLRHGRLLRPCRRDGAALRSVPRVGRALGLSVWVRRRKVMERRHQAVRAAIPVAVGAGHAR